MKKILATVVLAVMVVFATEAFAASNPFADVPAGHWSYDAVALLASRGVVSGYPDGQYKGGQLATRYEMASIVARALVYVDEGKASKEDLELVKKLVAEYKNELDALGVKVADLDKRVAGLEKGLKGLRLKGIFWMDAEWGGSDDPQNHLTDKSHGTQPSFSFARARLFIEKQVDENTFFQMRVNTTGVDGKGETFKVDRLWFSTKLPWDIKGTFGYQTTDWDSEYGLYDVKYGGWGKEDSFWTNLKFMGFDFRKDFGKIDVDVYVGRNTQSIDPVSNGTWTDQNYMTYGVKVGYKSEKLKLGVFFRGSKMDGSYAANTHFDQYTPEWYDQAYGVQGSFFNYGFYANWKIMNGLDLKGTFNHQQFCTEAYRAYNIVDGKPVVAENGIKNADYWQAVLEVDQSLLKLFSLWVQYGQIGRGFIYNNEAFNNIGYQSVLANFGLDGMFGTDLQFIKIGIHRNFTKKLEAYAAYIGFDNRADDFQIDRTLDFSIGFKYQYTPAIGFQLQYDWRDYGQGVHNVLEGKEDIFRFRTILSF